MPVNSEGVEVDYTSDETIEDMLDGENVDYCLEFVGYIVKSLGRAYIDSRNSELLKCIITNGSKNIYLLLWDVDQHEDLALKLVKGRILHLDNCKGQKKVVRNYHEQLNVLNYEILIEKKSTVTPMGFHIEPKTTPPIPIIEFIDLPKARGEITYIKTVIASTSSQSGNMSFGCGSLTNGIHKLPLQVASHKSNDSALLTKGTCVLVRGTISRKGPISIACPDISYIKILDEPKMSEKTIIQANKPLKRYKPDEEELKSNKKPCKENFSSSANSLNIHDRKKSD